MRQHQWIKATSYPEVVKIRHAFRVLEAYASALGSGQPGFPILEHPLECRCCHCFMIASRPNMIGSDEIVDRQGRAASKNCSYNLMKAALK